MMKSMTGYGKALGVLNGRSFRIELKSVNSKTLDLSFRMLPECRELEPEFRMRIAAAILRGKIDCTMSYVQEEGSNAPAFRHLNRAQIDTYMREWADISQEKPDMRFLMSLPGSVCENPLVRLDEEAVGEVVRVLNEAMAEMDASRLHEGGILGKDFRKRVGKIEELTLAVEPFEKNRVPAIRQKLEKQLAEWENAEKLADVNRLEQEMIYYLEKLDITEEKVRLHKHCAYFLQTMEEEASGRKLAFIAQEMGREINTLGSKANEADIQKLVVEMKDELEKIKEQLFNIL